MKFKGKWCFCEEPHSVAGLFLVKRVKFRDVRYKNPPHYTVFFSEGFETWFNHNPITYRKNDYWNFSEIRLATEEELRWWKLQYLMQQL